ncbi:universal stress protein [Mucilaginibacter sp. UR6-1]|uniref:universal stress protein n=1 Tax=Mucilaginibacter sp. UR6-1 TaxID=1435643 RepID=UPI001E2B909A|nr:universal stress protein [Mucilaginibacter sp. UR6-1]MCC8409628.1 universal stress protein [Mucilaginibacter sp. UR6-1]
MKEVLLLSDGSIHSDRAMRMAAELARLAGVPLVVANVADVKASVKVLVSGEFDETESRGPETTAYGEQIEACGLKEAELAQLINQRNSSLLISGLSNNTTICLHSILSRVTCPVLVLPEYYTFSSLKRITYMADLRYCQLPIVRYLANLGKGSNASVHVAHLPASGLPRMDESYALDVFNDGIRRFVNYDNLKFSNTTERNVQKATDVIINTMKTDLLALANHQYHFREVLQGKLTADALNSLHVPVLVFPG